MSTVSKSDKPSDKKVEKEVDKKVEKEVDKIVEKVVEKKEKKVVEKKEKKVDEKKVDEKKVVEKKVVEKKVDEKKPKVKKTESLTDSAVVSQLAGSVVESEVEVDKTRRVVNNEEVEKSFDALNSCLDKELSVLKEDKNHSVSVRFLKSLCRQLKTLKADCFRLLSRKVRKTSTRNGNSGFMKSVKISHEMAKFCNFKLDQLVSRVDVTKSICNYVKENNLQNKEDRRQFTPDAKLSALLDVKEVLTYYTLQKHIQKHFPKA
jgi:chromatin remodeling complex protein RSC6